MLIRNTAHDAVVEDCPGFVEHEGVTRSAASQPRIRQRVGAVEERSGVGSSNLQLSESGHVNQADVIPNRQDFRLNRAISVLCRSVVGRP